MIYGHDEGKNVKQLCDGETDAVCIEMGGTGVKTIEAARQKLNFIGTNIMTIDKDTLANWHAMGSGIAYFSQDGLITDQPNTYGFLINLVTTNNVKQIWISQPTGEIYTRGANVNGWIGTWVNIKGEVTTKSNIASSYFYASYVAKCGNVKELYLQNAKVAMNSGTAYTIGTLPEGYRPSLNFNERVIIASSASQTITGVINITTAGVMKFTPFASRAAGDVVHIHLTFV